MRLRASGPAGIFTLPRAERNKYLFISAGSGITPSLAMTTYLEREVYCCGPEPFMDAVREMLIALGFDMDRYHQESFGARSGRKTSLRSMTM